MNKEERKVKAPQSQVAGLKIIFASIFMGGSLLLDIYSMLNYPSKVWLVGALSLVFVIAVYFFSSSIMQLKYISQDREDEMYDELFKSSKATYLMMKKYFDEIQEQLDDMEEKMGVPVEEIVNAQKGIAKISISRNKENTDALMNSNDKLLEKIFDFEDQLSALENKLLSSQKSISGEGNQDVILKQQELSNLLKEIEVNLKREILNLSTKIQTQPQQIVMSQPALMPQGYMPEMQAAPVADPIHNEISDAELDDLVSKATEQLSEEAGDFEAEESVGEIISFEESVADIEEEPVEELVEELVEEPIEESVEEPVEEPIEESVEEPIEEPIEESVEEPVEEPIEESIEEPIEEAVEEPVIEPAVEEEKPPMPDLSDPNHVMTPDEIAALLANTMDETEAPAEEIVEEPMIEPAVEEEKPPMPDLSDPNHVMTPDEIAALLANTMDETEAPAEEIVEEPVVEEEKPPMPDLSDPNHVMTPDEIAALLANTMDETEAPEEEIIEPVEEEKPAMPDLSDPNHVMTPDEIAALLANM